MTFNHLKDHRFIEVMGALGEACGQESTPFKEQIYAKAFEDIPIEQFEIAAWTIIKTRTFASFPKVAEIRDAITGNVDDIGQVEAGKVWQAIKQHGASTDVCFDNPVTQAVIMQGYGGWIKLCSEMMEDKSQWFQKDFAKMYAAYARSGQRHYGALPGWLPMNGRSPRLIGNATKAQSVLIGNQNDTPEIVKSLVASL